VLLVLKKRQAGGKRRVIRMSSDVRKRSRQASDVRLTNSTNWFTGFGCGAGAFAFGVGYGFIGGGGIGYGPGMPYARPTVFFGVGFGSFVGVGVVRRIR